MDPTNKEIQLQRTARLLKFVNQQLDIPVSQKLQEAAKNTWCRDDYVPVLCKTIRGMTEDQLNTIVYNGRDATSRDLADWWDEHEAADRRREAKEQEQARQQALAESAMQKISREELAALKKWLLK
jgi:hypothetical protein